MNIPFFLILLFAASVFAQGINPDSLPVWKGYESIDEQKDTAETKEHSLKTTGSKSFQTSIGNGGADIQQELRLSIQGEAADGIYVDAYLADLGRPAGTEVTTTLRETDAAYISLESKRAKLEMGDLNYEINRNALFGFRRQTLGASGKLKGDNSEAIAIYGTDKTERQSVIFYGQPSQQKGYLLFSDSAFGLIAPHTERVYMNGRLLASGKDYEINYAGGVLDFLGKTIPGPEDEIRVEYDSYSSQSSKELRGVEAAYHSKYISLDIAGFNLRDSLKSDKMLGTRLGFLYGDLEMAMNENDDKAYKWRLGNEKVFLKGGYTDSGFAKREYEGTENAWDAYILRDRWRMDSVPAGDLRYDEFSATASLPYKFEPGFFIGHRNFEAVRTEGFLRRKQSKITFANVNGDYWQSEAESRFLQSYGNFRIDNEDNLRSVFGWEQENISSEIMREQTDTSGFSNWKTFISLKQKDWHSNTLFQIRKDENMSWLFDQSASYNNQNSLLRGEASYSFNYTNEVPWVAIYRKVPSGAGDVYYDSLTGQYISGADNGDFVYEGMGRADSLASKSYRNNLKWNLSAYPNILIKEGFLKDMTFFAIGEWLLHKSEKLLYLENSGLWERPKGSFMLTIINKWDEEPQVKEVLFGQEATARYKEVSLRGKREDVEFALSDLNWLSYEGELSWLRELGKGFSLQPFCSQKYATGFYMEDAWNTMLRKGGINGKWQNERGALAQLGVSGNYVEKSSEISPYSAVDGFEDGFSWRASALAQMEFGDHFSVSGQYILRIWRGEAFQKFNLEAKAVF
ncbi:MAG: hypothetical protein FWC26_09505 [Fibromonadales bacterium]|nr:hypothetical protein [Fibromonadales bacterium]